ncbi:MAG: FGGY-family carbohydrate kinase [Clostridiales bacterium]|nr:FGGY-family carbohydrate kinase [Clostridiales bacterium]
MYVIAYDIGTTGVKTCLFEVGDTLRLLAGEYEGYGLYILPGGGAEQDADEWWAAMAKSTRRLLEKTGTDPKSIAGISFCSQMQGLVLVDEAGCALRRPMSYMDQRGSREFAACQTHGLTISGVNALMLLRSLRRTRAASTSVKDPLWKYKWVQQNEPEVYAKIHKWLDVKEYLIGRCTGQFVMTRDSAYSTFLYDSRPDKGCWSRALCRMYGVEFDHLPRIIECTDVAGTLTARAAQDLGLAEGCPVYGGGGDATLIGVGAGCTEVGQTHIYSGTSGWVSTVIGRQKVDIVSMIAGIVGAQAGKYNYFAEMETAGKCFEWVKEHLVLDEIGIYLQKTNVAESQESVYESLYDYMTDTIEAIPPGAGGVIFTPWLHGNRCPFEDPKAAGIFFNLRLDTGKTEMLRAVLEGICYHLRWMLECQDKKVKIASTLRFVGGGALSRVTCQILADVTGRTVETVADTKDVGAVGAAMLVAVGSGQIADLTQAAGLIRPAARYTPDPANQALYDRNYKVFKNLYAANKKNFAALN